MAESKERKVTYGLKDLVIWFEGDGYQTAHKVPGIINLNRTMNTTTADQYADDVLYHRYVDEKNGDSTVSLVDFPDYIKARMLGWRIDSKGGLVHAKDATPERFHMAASVSSDVYERRKFIYGCEASMASDNNETRGETMSFRNEEATITEYGAEVNGERVWDYTVRKDKDPEGYEKSFSEVVYPVPAEDGPDATLSALTIGSLSLSPEFDPATSAYTATTSNATNAITATPADGSATVTVTVGGTAVDNGSAATWEDGENAVVVTVANGSAEKTYTVTVTKTGE